MNFHFIIYKYLNSIIYNKNENKKSKNNTIITYFFKLDLCKSSKILLTHPKDQRQVARQNRHEAIRIIVMLVEQASRSDFPPQKNRRLQRHRYRQIPEPG